ncbi:MAG TPA: hypothetical protein VN203_20295, partial [Candidatus Acidoferrum sp.]|nr:hypothetical protein [Candidatus Acidoferrum sp.]
EVGKLSLDRTRAGPAGGGRTGAGRKTMKSNDRDATTAWGARQAPGTGRMATGVLQESVMRKEF